MYLIQEYRFRPLSGSYISQLYSQHVYTLMGSCFRPLSGSYISQQGNQHSDWSEYSGNVSVPYRGATFLNNTCDMSNAHVGRISFPSPIGELHFSMLRVIATRITKSFRPLSGSYISQLNVSESSQKIFLRFRPLSGSYISQYHPRNPMSCLGRIGGLRGKSNFIEMQPFWKVKNSHKSNI